MSADPPRKAYKYTCNMIRPQIYSEKSLMESVVDFFSDVVPQAYTGTQKNEDKEKIQWVRFESCDCSDVAKNPDLFRSDTKGLPLLLILGYSNGVQIWYITPNGEAQEIVSIRQGPVRICRILPNPDPVLGNSDSFRTKRPLAVMCDSSSAGQPYCGVKFVSVKTGDELHNISFKTLPVQNIECNKRFLVIVFLEKVCVHEACQFQQLFWITSCFPCPGPTVNPIALTTRWLAYADKRLVPMHQSCGGMSGDGSQSYAATVISAAKGAFKGLSMFGEAMVNSVTGCKPPPIKRDCVQLDNGNRPGIVTVVDIQTIHNDHFNVNEDNEGDGLIAHFHAHANEPVANMAFDPTGTLLVTACKLGHNFHVFRLMAHPVSSSLGAVHHLYTLHRGETTAKVIDISFNHDSRWITVSSHRGTTHLFPITPYGGSVNIRTHSKPHVVNRASRFHRSAGLDEFDHSVGRRSPVLSTSPSSSGQYDRYPTLIQQNTLNNNMGNPRLPPYPHPITMYPAFQIKQPLNVALNPGNKNQSPSHSPTGSDNVYCVCAKFCTPRLCVIGSPKLDMERRDGGKRPVDSLYVMAQSGTLVEYVLEPRAKSLSDKVTDDCMLELNVIGRMQWNLQRLKNSQELRPPLPSNSPLILANEAITSQVPTAPDLYDLPGLTRHDSKDSLSSDHSSKDDTDEQWLSQVEIITHAGPHRRLWMGPQFSFKTYQENTTVLSSNSSSLLSQSPESNMAAMDMMGDEGDLESLKLQPTRSNPVSMPNARPAYRRLSGSDSPSTVQGIGAQSVPLLIEAGSFDQSPHLLDVYSNWTESTVAKQPRGSDDLEEDRLKETLADAMVESPCKDLEKLSLRHQDIPRPSVKAEKARDEIRQKVATEKGERIGVKQKEVEVDCGKSGVVKSNSEEKQHKQSEKSSSNENQDHEKTLKQSKTKNEKVLTGDDAAMKSGETSSLKNKKGKPKKSSKKSVDEKVMDDSPAQPANQQDANCTKSVNINLKNPDNTSKESNLKNTVNVTEIVQEESSLKGSRKHAKKVMNQNVMGESLTQTITQRDIKSTNSEKSNLENPDNKCVELNSVTDLGNTDNVKEDSRNRKQENSKTKQKQDSVKDSKVIVKSSAKDEITASENFTETVEGKETNDKSKFVGNVDHNAYKVEEISEKEVTDSCTEIDLNTYTNITGVVSNDRMAEAEKEKLTEPESSSKGKSKRKNKKMAQKGLDESNNKTKGEIKVDRFKESAKPCISDERAMNKERSDSKAEDLSLKNTAQSHLVKDKAMLIQEKNESERSNSKISDNVSDDGKENEVQNLHKTGNKTSVREDGVNCEPAYLIDSVKKGSVWDIDIKGKECVDRDGVNTDVTCEDRVTVPESKQMMKEETSCNKELNDLKLGSCLTNKVENDCKTDELPISKPNESRFDDPEVAKPINISNELEAGKTDNETDAQSLRFEVSCHYDLSNKSSENTKSTEEYSDVKNKKKSKKKKNAAKQPVSEDVGDSVQCVAKMKETHTLNVNKEIPRRIETEEITSERSGMSRSPVKPVNEANTLNERENKRHNTHVKSETEIENESIDKGNLKQKVISSKVYEQKKDDKVESSPSEILKESNENIDEGKLKAKNISSKVQEQKVGDKIEDSISEIHVGFDAKEMKNKEIVKKDTKVESKVEVKQPSSQEANDFHGQEFLVVSKKKNKRKKKNEEAKQDSPKSSSETDSCEIPLVGNTEGLKNKDKGGKSYKVLSSGQAAGKSKFISEEEIDSGNSSEVVVEKEVPCKTSDNDFTKTVELSNTNIETVTIRNDEDVDEVFGTLGEQKMEDSAESGSKYETAESTEDDPSAWERSEFVECLEENESDHDTAVEPSSSDLYNGKKREHEFISDTFCTQGNDGRTEFGVNSFQTQTDLTNKEIQGNDSNESEDHGFEEKPHLNNQINKLTENKADLVASGVVLGHFEESSSSSCRTSEEREDIGEGKAVARKQDIGNKNKKKKRKNKK